MNCVFYTRNVTCFITTFMPYLFLKYSKHLNSINFSTSDDYRCKNLLVSPQFSMCPTLKHQLSEPTDSYHRYRIISRTRIKIIFYSKQFPSIIQSSPNQPPHQISIFQIHLHRTQQLRHPRQPKQSASLQSVSIIRQPIRFILNQSKSYR